MAELIGNEGLIAVTLGFTTMEMVKLWQTTAPTLKEAREAEPGDITIQQRVMDANYLVAGIGFMVGGTVSWISKSWLPILLALGSASFISWWYKQVLMSANGMMHNDQ